MKKEKKYFKKFKPPPPTGGKVYQKLHYRSNLKNVSKVLKFGINMFHKILRPMVKRSAQSDWRFITYLFPFFRPKKKEK